MSFKALRVWLFLATKVFALGSTDTITWGGDNSRTGYQSNHNMDPAVVGSSSFGQIFKTQLPGNLNGAAEQIFSQPLVYTTPKDGIQYLFIATTQNNIYKLDAKTGAIIAKRNLAVAFVVADLMGCSDITPYIGITSTGVIDPDTDTWYLTSKTYQDQSPNGVRGLLNGRYYAHAINVNDLSEMPNFPVPFEGAVARNNPIRSFNGGIHHQRPGLLHTGQYIYAGFASHCTKFNYTGWIIGWDKTSGAIVERFSTEGAGVPNNVPGGGIWMSGGGLASDDAGSLYFASGNGHASQLNGVPLDGHFPPTSLEEAAVHMTINTDGTLKVVDFFMPFEKVQLDGADRDLGTTPLQLLPPEFQCGDVKRIGVVTGKSGKTYWINLDNMGGYQTGPNKLDAVLQVYQNENSVYAGAGVYPKEGGFIYINVNQYKTHAFQFTCTNGVPFFSKVADSPENNSFSLGTGHGSVTSMNDQPGTGLLWTCDVTGYNLRVYKAVPQNGNLIEIARFNIDGMVKFTRAVFGNGRVYLGTLIGQIVSFGAPVNLPLNCSSPYNFGIALLNNQTAPKTIVCTANIATRINSIQINSNGNFNISSLPALPLQLATGASFTFKAVFGPSSVGILSSDIIVNTTNSIKGYSIDTPISLQGEGQSVNPILAISPVTLAFQGVITEQELYGVNQTVIFSNLGNSDLSISSLKYSIVSETGPFVAPTITPSGPKIGPFTFIGLPSILPKNSVTAIIVNFNAPTSGNFAAYITVNSDGGSKIFDVVGTSSVYPTALIEFQTIDGTGWIPYSNLSAFSFGNVTENKSRFLKMRLTNTGGPNAGSLSVTVSKPPLTGIIAASNSVDLSEGTSLGPGQNASAFLYCAVPKENINSDSYVGSATWEFNTNDPNFGHHSINFVCNAVSEQYPPFYPNGSSMYRYVGCFKDFNPGRQMIHLSTGANNTNEMCHATCYAAGYSFAGTQYHQECWCSSKIPNLQVADSACNYACTGNPNEVCGGNGVANVGASGTGTYISLYSSVFITGNSISSSLSSASTSTVRHSSTSISSSKKSSSLTSSKTSSSTPSASSSSTPWLHVGCANETSPRALSQATFSSNSMTVENCQAYCMSQGLSIAGVEYGRECYCGNALAQNSKIGFSGCTYPCSGDSSQTCGGSSRLDVYRNTAYIAPSLVTAVGSFKLQGCYTEPPAGRALGSFVYRNATSMTAELCIPTCQGQGYSWAGLEWGQECWCANSLGSGATSVSTTSCNMICPGNSLEFCGASKTLVVYKSS